MEKQIQNLQKQIDVLKEVNALDIEWKARAVQMIVDYNRDLYLLRGEVNTLLIERRLLLQINDSMQGGKN